MSPSQDQTARHWALPGLAGSPAIPARPADVLRELVTLLRSYGLDHVYWSACTLCGVLSLPHVTVWLYDGRFLTWRHGSTAMRWPAADTEGAAKHLVALAGRTIT
jgi:hypothetical protein